MSKFKRHRQIGAPEKGIDTRAASVADRSCIFTLAEGTPVQGSMNTLEGLVIPPYLG